MNDQRQQEMERRLEALRHRYLAQLGERAEEIDSAWKTAVAASDPAAADWSVLFRHVHHLAGTAGMLGLAEIGRAAMAFEEVLEYRISSGLRPEETEFVLMKRLVEMLQAHIE